MKHLPSPPFLKVYNSKDFTTHEEAVLRRLNERERKNKKLKKILRVFVKIALSVTGTGAIGELAETVAESVGNTRDGLDIAREMRSNDSADYHNLNHGDRYNVKIAEEQASVRTTFTTLLRKEEGEAESLPVILLLDNAHTMDNFSLDCLEEIWELAVKESLPLYVLATHWETEWELEHEEGLDRSAISSSFAKFFLDQSERNPETIHEYRLQGLKECNELLRIAFPNFEDEDINEISHRACGNPRHMTEIILALEGMQRNQRKSKPYFTEDRVLTEHGKTAFFMKDLALESLEKERFDAIEFDIKNILSLASRQGMEYLSSFVSIVAARVDNFLDDLSPDESLSRAIKPHAIVQDLSNSIHEFRSVSMHKNAYTHFFAEHDNSEIDIIHNIIIDAGIELLLPNGWKEVEVEAKELLLEYLYNHGREHGSGILCLLTTVHALSKIYAGGSWASYTIWRERWNSLESIEEIISNATTLSQRDFAWLEFTLGFISQMQREWEEALENYNNAIEHKEKTGQEQQLGATYHQIGMVYEEQREWEEALENYNKAIDWNEKTGQEQQLGTTYHQIGIVYQMQREWEEALENYNKAIEHKQKTGQEQELGGTYHQIGRVYQEQREWEEALENYNKAIDWNEKTGQEHQLGLTYHQIGMVYEEQREWEEALENYNKAIDWNEKTGQEQQLGTTYHQIGMVYEEQREWEEALENYNKAIDWYEKTGQEQQLGTTYHQIGMVYQMQREWEEALENYNKAIDWYEKTGQEFELGGTYHQIGMVYQMQREWEEALENYNKAIEYKKKTGQEQQLGTTYHQIGRVYQMQREWEEALENYNKAIDWYEKTGQEFELGGTYHQIGMVYQMQREWEEALENYNKAIDWYEKTGQEFELGGTYHQIGRVYQMQREWEEALENYNKAIDWNEKTGQEQQLGTTYHQIGRVYQMQREWEEALENYNKAIEYKKKTGQEQELGSTYAVLMLSYSNMAENFIIPQDPSRLQNFAAKYGILSIINIAKHQPHMFAQILKEACKVVSKFTDNSGEKGELIDLINGIFAKNPEIRAAILGGEK